MTATAEQVDGALASIASALESDGYRLTSELVGPNEVTVRITALEGACEECLVPRAVMAPMIDGVLRSGGIDAKVADIIYPGVSKH